MRTLNFLGLFLATTNGCAIEDGTAFGLPYTIAADPMPIISSDEVVFTATYSSTCSGGGSSFEVTRFGEDAGEAAPAILSQSVMLVAFRHEPECASPLPFEQEVTVEVTASLPARGSTTFLACPPGSTYEMVKIEENATSAPAATKPAFLQRRMAEKAAAKPADWDEEEDGPWEPSSAMPMAAAADDEEEDESSAFSDPVKEAERVAAELATQDAEDSIHFLAHCEAKIAEGKPCGCCSALMMEGLRNKIAADAAAAASGDKNESAAAAVEEATVDAFGGVSAAAAGVGIAS